MSPKAPNTSDQVTCTASGKAKPKPPRADAAPEPVKVKQARLPKLIKATPARLTASKKEVTRKAASSARLQSLVDACKFIITSVYLFITLTEDSVLNSKDCTRILSRIEELRDVDPNNVGSKVCSIHSTLAMASDQTRVSTTYISEYMVCSDIFTHLVTLLGCQHKAG